MTEYQDNLPKPETTEPVKGYVVINKEKNVMAKEGFWAPNQLGDPDTHPFVHTASNLAAIVDSSDLRWGQFLLPGSTPPEAGYPAVFNPTTGQVTIDMDNPLNYNDLLSVVRPELEKRSNQKKFSAGPK